MLQGKKYKVIKGNCGSLKEKELLNRELEKILLSGKLRNVTQGSSSSGLESVQEEKSSSALKPISEDILSNELNSVSQNSYGQCLKPIQDSLKPFARDNNSSGLKPVSNTAVVYGINILKPCEDTNGKM